MDISIQIAQDLLEVEAVTLSPNKAFQWVSGIKSPIYTDNRLIIGYPDIRMHITSGLARLIMQKYPEVNTIGGVVTAGVPHATSVADRLGLPLCYVRSQPKDHGKGKQVEGHLPSNAKIVLIDDLISTGGSILKAAKALQDLGYEVIGLAAIFTYELPEGIMNFQKAGLPLFTLTDYSHLIEQAQQKNILTEEEKQDLLKWRENPWAWR